jgi:hypothetical protein
MDWAALRNGVPGKFFIVHAADNGGRVSDLPAAPPIFIPHTLIAG